jgi:hypothetical protein
MGMGVTVSVDVPVTVAVVSRWDRVEVDAGLRDRRLHLGPIPFRVIPW